MIARRETASWALAILACLVAWYVSLSPAPYRNVDLLRFERIGDDVAVEANFDKTGCIFERLTVIGGVAGETDFLRWRDLDGLEVNHDRSTGSQTLRIAILVTLGRYDWIEIRTRHDCDGEQVDKVFWRFEPVA